MRETEAALIADARAERFWAARARRNERRRAARAEEKQRPACCQCGAAPVMKGMDAGGHCAACDAEIRRLFSADEYARIWGGREEDLR